LGAYNAHCFGSPWSLSYSHLEGNFLKNSGAGIYGISLPGVKAGLSLLFSPSRGLFFIMPILVMALPGLWKLKREEAAVILAIALSTWLINSGFYGWHGGWTFGPRYLTLALPFLILPLAFSLDLAWFAVLFPLSALQIGLAVAGMPHAPEALVNPLVECLHPLFQYGYMADNAGRLLGFSGAASLLPWLLATLALIWWAGPRQALADKIAAPWWARKILYPAALAGVLGGLLLTHSSRPGLAHAYNWKLLQDVNLDLHSEALRLAGEKELALSKK